MWTEWTYTYTVNGSINSICGFGKETPASRSQSFLSAAFYNDDVPQNVYAFELDPHLQMTSATRSLRDAKNAHEELEDEEYLEIDESKPHLGKASFKYSLETVSTLVIGGYDKNDIVGDLAWYDTSACVGAWNITAQNMTVGEVNIMPVAETDTVVEFQTAYPFIGLSGVSWNATIALFNDTLNPDIAAKFACGGSYGFNEYCYWTNTYCSDVNMPSDFVI